MPLEWFSKKWSFRAFHHSAGVSAGNDPTSNPTVGCLASIDRAVGAIHSMHRGHVRSHVTWFFRF